MKRKLVPGALLLCLLWYSSPIAGGSFRVETTYYSDYFTTVAGCEISWCDNEYASDGTLDGAYKRVVMTNCTTGATNRYCYVKNGSSWSSITCPQNLPDDHPCW
jgi:hypothetical protein